MACKPEKKRLVGTVRQGARALHSMAGPTHYLRVFLFAAFLATTKADNHPEPEWRIESLLAALGDPSEDVQRNAIIWMAEKKIEDQRVATKLGELLTDNSKDRAAILRALSSTGPYQLPEIGRVIQQLSHRDAEIRRQALVTIGGIRPVERIAIKSVIEKLADSDGQVRRHAIAILTNRSDRGGAFAGSFIGLTRDHENEVRYAAIQSLGQMGTNAISFYPELFALMSDPDATVRMHSIEVIATIAPTSNNFIEALDNLIDDPSDQVRIKALEVIGAMPRLSTNIESRLPKLAIDRTQMVRNRAVSAMLSHGGSNEVTVVAEFGDALKDPDPNVRAYALQVLQSAGVAANRFATPIFNLLHDTDRWVRRNAILTLQSFNSNLEYTSAFADLLNDVDPDVRRTAFDALSNTSIEKLRPVIDKFLVFLSDRSYTNREQIVELLGHDPTNASIIARQLNDSSVNVKKQALLSLASLGSKARSYESSIAELLNDNDESVRQAAIQALENTSPSTAAPQIAKLLNDRSNMVRQSALIALGTNAEGGDYASQTAELLKDPATRLAAISALGRMGANGAKFSASVGAYLTNPNGRIRSTASAALESMGISLDTKTLFATVEAAHADRRDEKGRSRFLGYLISKPSSTNLVILRWLGDRSETERSALPSQTEIRQVITIMRSLWSQLRDYPQTKKEAAELLTSFARANQWKLSDVPMLIALQGDFQKAALFSQASEIQNLISEIKTFAWVKRAIAFLLGQIALWFALLIAYPHSPLIQAWFFWNGSEGFSGSDILVL
jgi:HEAT repeat protein